jgi:KDO2-lipid IV(A) lauroyltransferase
MSDIKLKHRLEYLLLRGLSVTARTLSEKKAESFGSALGSFAFNIIKIRRSVALDNLNMAYPENNLKQNMEIARRLYSNLGRNLLEFMRLPDLASRDIFDKVNFIGREHFDQALKNGKGALLISSHFGNWELYAAAVANYGYPISMVVYEQNNRLSDKLMNDIRRLKKLGVIYKQNAPRAILKELSRNHFVAIVIDQDAGQDGLFVDFMGRPASTAKGPAVFAIRTGAPLLVGVIVRGEVGRHTGFVEPPIYANAENDKDAEIKRLTARMTEITEKYVRKYPDHWYWVHRRWKTQPQKT